MANRRHERTLARRQAIQVLYQSEIRETTPAEVLAEGHAFVDDVTPSAYAVTLIEGVGAHMAAINDQLSACSENWALDRMPLMDRAILRLACYEMVFVDDVPVSVAINEAVDLAKDFGGEDDSPKFVNGVLGKIAKLLDSGAISKAALSDQSASGAASVAPAGDSAPVAGGAGSGFNGVTAGRPATAEDVQ
jgi:N utilization substance protein B